MGQQSSRTAPCSCSSFGSDTRRLSAQYSLRRNNPDRHGNDSHHSTSTTPISRLLCDQRARDTFWQDDHNAGRCGKCREVVPCGTAGQSDGICTAGDARFLHGSSSCCGSCASAHERLCRAQWISRFLTIPSREASSHARGLKAPTHCWLNEPSRDCAVHTCANTDQVLDGRAPASGCTRVVWGDRLASHPAAVRIWPPSSSARRFAVGCVLACHQTHRC